MAILLNDGQGHLRRAGSYPTGRDPVAVSAGRFDRTPGTDLVVADHGSRDLRVFLRRPASQEDRRVVETELIHEKFVLRLDGPMLEAVGAG